MPIKLRIVGIFYDRSDIPDTQKNGEPHTVKTVLDYATQNPVGTSTAFGYITGKSAVQGTSPTAGIESITAFCSIYENPGQTGPVSKTSGITYPQGEYFLSESLVQPPSYRIWQYYVSDAYLQSGNATYIPRSPRIQSYTTAEVPAGGEVVWRLVEILAEPNRIPVVYRGALGADGGAQIV